MKLPHEASRITGDEVVRTLKRGDFIFDRQRGSHVILDPQRSRRVSVPVHAGKTIKLGTLFVERMDQNEEIFARFMNEESFRKVIGAHGLQKCIRS